MAEEGKRKQARRHHYLPQFYLAGFTPSGKKEDKLWVFDLDTGKKFTTTTENVACEKDLYRWEGVTEHEDFLETETFQKLDNKASKIIESILQTKTIPSKDTDEYSYLMQFIAAFKIRTPWSQKQNEELTEQIIRAITNVVTQSEERWQIFRNRALGEEGKDFSKEQMREVVFDESKYTIKVQREAYLKTMSDRLKPLFEILWEREWSFCETQESHLICSDYPLVVDWTIPNPSNKPPGLAHSNTAVSIPLTKKAVLIGSFEKHFMSPISKELVGVINFLEAAVYAHRFIFSADEDFSWLKNDGYLGHAEELIKLIQNRRGRPLGRPDGTPH